MMGNKRYDRTLLFLTSLQFTILSYGFSKRLRCYRSYKIAFSSSVPYTERNGYKGLVTTIFEDSMLSCCKQDIHFNYTFQFSSRKELFDLLSSNEADFLIPVQRYISEKRISGHPFVSIVETPGFAFYVVPKANIFDIRQAINVIGPVFIIMFIMTGISGTLFWMAENLSLAPLGESHEPFLSGVMAGIWWAFVTMTTVGYGDIVPKTKLGRILCLVWVLFGIAFSSFFISSMTTLIISTFVENDIEISNTEIAVLKDSEEYSYVAARQGIPIIHENIEEILESLHRRRVLTGVIDTFLAGDYQEELSSFKLQNIIEYPFANGVVFMNNGFRHTSCVRDYIYSRQDDIYNHISKRVRGLKNSPHTNASKFSLINASQPFFYIPVSIIISFWIAIMIMKLLKKRGSCQTLKEPGWEWNVDDALNTINDEYRGKLIKNVKLIEQDTQRLTAKYNSLIEKLEKHI